MVDINLIPLSLRKSGKGSGDAVAINIPQEIILGVGGALIFLLVTTHVVLGSMWLMAEHRLSFNNTQWQRVEPVKTEFENINKDTGELKKKIALLTELTANKLVRWAPKFNAISDVLPKGLWIRKMTLDKVGLTVEGSVVSKNQNEINDVGVFLSALKQNDDFMKDISSLEVNSIQRGKNNAVDVTDFTVMAKLK